MNTRTAIAISITTIALTIFAFLGGRLSKEKQTISVQSMGTDNAAGLVNRLKLVYPKKEIDHRDVPEAPAKSAIPRRNHYSYQSSVEMLVYKLKGISLSAEEKAQMQDVYNVVFEARQRYERLNARITKISGGTVIEIPAYEAFGAQLRGTLTAAFESILGHDKALAVTDQIGTQFDVENTYWGKYPQIIQANYDAANKRVRITRSINPTPEDPDAFQQATDSHLSPENLDSFSIFGDVLVPKQ